MTRMRPFPFLAAMAAVGLPLPGAAQVLASERATLSQTISGTEIVLDYGRPSARGRTELFGGQVPWGEVWTPGANMNTTLHVSKDVTLGGHEVAAGTYGVWIQVREHEPWQFLLHEDTTLFHTMHPSLDDGILTFPVERETGLDFVETLTLDLQEIRADGARLTLAWGLDRVSVELGVDPGFVLTVSAEEAARYVGDWTVDQSMGLPPEEMREQIRSGMAPEEQAVFETWLELAARPQAARIRHDDEGHLIVETPALDSLVASVEGEGFQTVLLPRAEGIFVAGVLFRGELAFAGEQGFFEFEFDDAGRAVALVMRDPSDAIMGQGTREGADPSG